VTVSLAGVAGRLGSGQHSFPHAGAGGCSCPPTWALLQGLVAPVTAYARFDLPRRPGRPPCCSSEARERSRELKDQGRSLRQIARALNAEGVPTPMRRAQWNKSHVWRVLGTLYMKELEKISISRLPTGGAPPASQTAPGSPGIAPIG
jgi:hypothetical protein